YLEVPVVGGIISTLDEWRELPNIGRFGKILEAEDGTGRVRTLIWGGALKLVLPHEPLDFPQGGSDTWNVLRSFIGYGPESMYVAYNRFYPPELATLEARNASPDRSHNETFDALVITGFLGFAVWQILYISVFYFGFQWLGVLRSKRERNLLVGLWFGTGVLVALLFSLWRGSEYIGVAYPFGAIGGLVVYLIYYALFSPVPEEEADPFSANRLLMVGLLAGVLAHYVEIHFGIAIAVTRLYFFVFVGLMLVVGYVLPLVQETAVSTPTHSKKRRAAQPVSEKNTAWGAALLSGMMLALMLGVIGFTFVNFAPPPGVTYNSAAELPAMEIFQQALFVNAGNDYADSPFIFLMIILTWGLGTLVVVAELVKSGELVVAEDTALPAQKRQLFGGVFILLALVSFSLRLFLPQPAGAGATWMLGRSLMLLLAMLYAYVGARFLLRLPAARLWGGIMALASVLLAVPVLVSGGVWLGLGTAVVGLILLWQLWQSDWNNSLLPAGTIAFLSLVIGISYTYVQAGLLKASLFVPLRKEIVTQTDLLEHRVYEASQSATFLTLFYVFVFTLIFLAAFAASQRGRASAKEGGSIAGFASLALFLLGFLFINTSNMNVVQADMIYKRAKPFDQQAGGQGDPNMWDTAIAIYEKAIDMTPAEDFYYLFLGRAFLERSALAQDDAERDALLSEAQVRLLEAQAINPLNTDHTANLARLNTRWVELTNDEQDRAMHLADAENYYQEAILLSPQNSILRNEYARLVLGLKDDCEGAMAVYDETIGIDPYFDEIYFGRADTQILCADNLPEAERQAAYDEAIADLETGLAVSRGNPRAMLRVGQLKQEIGRYEEAILEYEAVRQEDQGELVPEWNLDYLIATVYQAQGDIDLAVKYAQDAMLKAPPETVQQLQVYVQQLTGEPIEPLPELTPETVAPESLSGERPLSALPPANRANIYNTPPPTVINEFATYDAIITTENGQMRLRLFPEEAPITVNNFVF
ncbi:MAG: hypothetical protein IAF02_23130, partial [Anaerolineae bacterium]|nr:hypothetical protein [Anaerolineae bacterium]